MNRGRNLKRGTMPRVQAGSSSTPHLVANRTIKSFDDVYLTCADDEDAVVNIHFNGHTISFKCGEDWEGNLLVQLNDEKILLKQEWQHMNVKTQKLYSPMEFIEAAERCLEEDPPNVVQSSEKCWGSLGSAIALFCKDLTVVVQEGSSTKTLQGLNLKTHKATIAMAGFAANFSSQGARLGGVIECVKRGHRNFIRGFLSSSQMRKTIKKMKFFIKELNKIDKRKVEEELTPLVNSGKYQKIIFHRLTRPDYICCNVYNFDIQVTEKEYIKEDKKSFPPKK
ncbi:unnamed protein product [Meloidogyne enterolobii]|uniref:Uncharacterized protein n=1 Tax=Meloidogyne enterolobii TaxID=390850 RepID=A0ACB0YGJ8_MELEN